jgi:hypothetical protein
LIIHGNEVEVQLAFEKLGDDDIFFDWQTPRHLKAGHDHSKKEEKAEDHREQAPSPRPFLNRDLSIGSQRRLKIIEDRKQEKSALWQAHESGIAVTQSASKKSLLNRTGSFTSVLSGNSHGQIPLVPSANSLASSTVSGVQQSAEIFRRVETNKMRAASPMRKARYQRSRSLVMIPPPRVPEPVKITAARRSSSASRKSVTFHPETPHRESKKTLRRSVSDIFSPPSLDDDNDATDPKPTSRGRPPLAQRSDSVTSIPSIQYAHPVRSDSISSIPSIHHGHAIRSDSIGSIPSIHHANAIRSNSVTSIPSIHSAHPIHNSNRSESVSSTPSIHHGNYTNSLFDDDDPSTPGTVPKTKILIHRNSVVDENNQQLFPTYSATPDIASAWLNQKQGHFKSKAIDVESNNSFPPVIIIPSTITDVTEGTSSTTEGTETQGAEKPLVVNEKSVLVRRASKNSYEGEGMEVTQMDENERPMTVAQPFFGRFESINKSIRTCNSFDDESMSHYSQRQNNYDDIFRSSIRRTLSDEEVAAANILVGSDGTCCENWRPLLFPLLHNSPIFLLRILSTVNVLFRDVSNMTVNRKGSDNNALDGSSWDLNSEVGDDRFDSWNILKDEYVNGYGGGGTLDFKILGTCADDQSASPHVLSPPLMESLSGFLPYSKSGENFFLRYSLVRDGASMLTFLKRSRGVQYGVLALETVDGEVFGCFTGQAWRKNWNYFGNGESFLWKMRRSRLEKTSDVLDQAQLESEIDVYPYTGENKYIQLCTQDRIAVGGGMPNGEKKTEDPLVKSHEWGFGLAIQGDLLVGSSSPCVTFGSPSLSNVHSDGSLFEIVNLELWTLTPCVTKEEAENLEVGKLFLQRD